MSAGQAASRAEDLARVSELLGRPPRGDWAVAVRRQDGSPVVIWSAPQLEDGTPMPTLYWLVGRPEREAVSRLEAAGGVKAAEAAVDPERLAAAHAAYAAERERLPASSPAGSEAPRPFGGVGGTRRGVKCLHAHLAFHLAGGDDPVGRWTAEMLALEGGQYRTERLPGER